MRLAEIPFVVTDVETTGIDPGRHRVIEIAAVKVVGGVVVDRFTRLVNPGRAVPRRITALTGISTAMLYGEPPPGEVLPGYLDFLGDGVFVAHNLPFDRGFLDAELARLGRPALTNPGLCTLRLARRLLRGLRSKSLGSIAAFYGLSPNGRHRALGDAELTAQVLLRLLSQLGFQAGLETLDELLAFQNKTYVHLEAGPGHLQRLREEVVPRLPRRPGVYFMKDGQGTILYIGKAKSLRDRVRSYFTGIESHAEHIRQMVAGVRDVAWEETGSELAALLLESKLIKAHRPRFNRAQRRYRNRPFIRLDVTEPFPRVRWQAFLADDGAEYFGPLGGRREAEQVVELIQRYYRLRECDDDTFARGHRCLYAAMGRCDGPCEGGDAAGAYAAEVQRVRDFLTGRDRTVLERLEADMRAAAANLDFEQAAALRDARDMLARLLDRQQAVAAAVLDHHAVMVLPGPPEADDPGPGAPPTARLLCVRFGRLVATLTLPLPPGADDVIRLRARLARHFDPGSPRPERYLKEEVDEVRLLAHWLYVHRGRTPTVRWQPGDDFEAFVAAVLHEARRLLR
ncbi:DEDD exonuclease domain-containing protein [Rhodocaloribacter litoris]|uniref:DEDD exonuclease domain-containing protein n=1 Tax=Rhodocaloribacter litoris TaxID=2558931 RepID=UPI001420E3D5|nr:DEDD exonuclease domain-containing protein [Rhodocaloribacter litoris]QXD14644.1 DEDD exonuclease domain-containing protein [Rhodocaloribacter litoris]